MKRGSYLTAIASASLALGMMAPKMYEPTHRVKPLPNVPDHRPSAKKWTCKRCGEKFTPHRSPTYCDRCQAQRMGDPKARDGARDAIRMIAQSGMPVNPTYARELYDIAEWPLPKHLEPVVLPPVEPELLRKAERALFLKDADE